MDSWETAKMALNQRYDWDPNNTVTTDFLNVVRRRFLK
jgi:hypothetical protein